MNASRVGDMCTGHGCFAPRPSLTGSDNVFINTIPAHRVGDVWKEHSCVSTHDSTLAQGSATVFVNGVSLGRVGDLVACGSTIATGSDNVFCGG